MSGLSRVLGTFSLEKHPSKTFIGRIAWPRLPWLRFNPVEPAAASTAKKDSGSHLD